MSKQINMRIAIFFVLVFSNIYSQTVEIKYDFILLDEKDDYGDVRAENLTLITSQSKSILNRTAKDTVFESNLYGIYESGVGKSNSYKLTEFKDLKNKKYYFLGAYSNKIIADDEYPIKWEIQAEQKKILAYQCQKATGKFRGRDYVVFFTSELPIQNGPFKFDGLPGLILEVISVDNAVKIIAKSVKKNENDSLENPFQLKEVISWTDFKKNYRKYFDSVKNYKSDNESEMFIPNRGIEFYLE